jgi:hypothetical protein
VALLSNTSGDAASTALRFDPAFDVPPAQAGVGRDAALRAAVQTLLQQIQVGADNDELAALITDDLLRPTPNPSPGSAATGIQPTGRGLVTGPPAGAQRVAPGLGTGSPANAPSARPGLVVQRRGPSVQPLTPALRALGLALGSPEFQRY